MVTKIILILSFLFCFLIPGVFAESLKDGFYNEYNGEGYLIRTIEYRYGQPHGRFRTFYKDGLIKGWGEFVNG